MFTVTLSPCRYGSDPANTKHVVSKFDFTVTAFESLEQYSGEFTMGSAHDEADFENVKKMVIQSLAFDMDFLNGMEDSSVRGIVAYLVDEQLEPDAKRAFEVADILAAFDVWTSKLTTAERSHLQDMLED